MKQKLKFCKGKKLSGYILQTKKFLSFQTFYQVQSHSNFFDLFFWILQISSSRFFASVFFFSLVIATFFTACVGAVGTVGVIQTPSFLGLG
jgi:hypothetical protein